MNANPYALDHDLEVSFAGYVSGSAGAGYVYRLELAEAKGMESCMFQMKVSQWLFDNLMPGDWKMGNDKPFGSKKVANPGTTDVFVCFEGLHAAIQFEDSFKVTGLTQSMLVP